MAFLAPLAEGLAGGEAAGLFGGRMASGGLFGSTEAEAAGNIAGMAPGPKHNVNLSTQITPLLGLKEHSYTPADTERS